MIELRGTDPSCPYPCPSNGNLGLTQITFAAGGNHHPVTNRGGEAIAFESDADPLGRGEHETQVYVAFPLLGEIIALSHGPGTAHNPTIARNGRRIAFESDADLLRNGSTGTQIFVYRDLSGAAEQVTYAPGALSTEPSLSTNGRRAAVHLDRGPARQRQHGGSQVFQYDLGDRRLRQVTAGTGTPRHGAYSAGVFTAFVADGDLLGTGATGPELYFVNLFQLGRRTVP